METFYLVLMAGVAVIILATMVEAIRAVSRKPVWEQASQPIVFFERRTENQPYTGVERRTQSLPYVGVERRKARRAQKADVATTDTTVQEQRKVA